MKRFKQILLGIAILLSSLIHAQPLLSYPLDTVNGKVYYRYTVPRGIGIYRIGINFGVTQEEILQANPYLLTEGLHYDEVILIPAKISIDESMSSREKLYAEEKITYIDTTDTPDPIDTVSIQTLVVQNNNKTRIRKNKRAKTSIKDSLVSSQDSTIGSDSITMDSIAPTIRLAIMLPLYKNAIKRDKNMDRFFDFYAGALLAINEVQQEGQNIEVFTYDVEKSAKTTKMILQDSAWQHVDAIIGPAYPQQVTVATQYAHSDSTWILVPFLPNLAEVQYNPYILKFNPSTDIAAETMAKYLDKISNSINCVIIERKETDNIPTSILQLHKALNKHNIPTTTTTLRQIYTDSIDSAFVDGKENIVIFNTENYNNIQALIPHLLQASKRYLVTLYSQYSWADKDILLPQIYTSAFTNTLLEHNGYNDAFQKYFGHELSSVLPRYDLLGYDLTLHLLRMLQQSHQNGSNTLPTDSIWQGVQTNIQYKKTTPQGGYENQTIHIIHQ